MDRLIWWAGIAVLLVILGFFFSGDGKAQTIASLRQPIVSEKKPCPVPTLDSKQIRAAGYDINDKVYWLAFDTNGDLVVDYFVEYEIIDVKESEDSAPEVKRRPFPIRYMLDSDYDGYFDKFYHDLYGNGRCEDIVEFQPTSKDPKGLMR